MGEVSKRGREHSSKRKKWGEKRFGENKIPHEVMRTLARVLEKKRDKGGQGKREVSFGLKAGMRRPRQKGRKTKVWMGDYARVRNRRRMGGAVDSTFSRGKGAT